MTNQQSEPLAQGQVTALNGHVESLLFRLGEILAGWSLRIHFPRLRCES